MCICPWKALQDSERYIDILNNVKIVEALDVLECMTQVLIRSNQSCYGNHGEIGGHLAVVFASPLAIDERAEDCTLTNVNLLFQKDCRDKLCSCRPVSLLSVTITLLDKSQRETIYVHLERLGMIRDNQHECV